LDLTPIFTIFSDVIDLAGYRGHLPGDCYSLWPVMRWQKWWRK